MHSVWFRAVTAFTVVVFCEGVALCLKTPEERVACSSLQWHWSSTHDCCECAFWWTASTEHLLWIPYGIRTAFYTEHDKKLTKNTNSMWNNKLTGPTDSVLKTLLEYTTWPGIVWIDLAVAWDCPEMEGDKIYPILVQCLILLSLCVCRITPQATVSTSSPAGEYSFIYKLLSWIPCKLVFPSHNSVTFYFMKKLIFWY